MQANHAAKPSIQHSVRTTECLHIDEFIKYCKTDTCTACRNHPAQKSQISAVIAEAMQQTGA
jgi:hypothetical protein